MEKLGTILDAHPTFLLVISYNPGYQNVLKDLKPSTRQRFVAIDFDYPAKGVEAEIIAHESGVDAEMAGRLASLGEKIRNSGKRKCFEVEDGVGGGGVYGYFLLKK